MKYFTAIFSLFFLSLVASLLSLHFGKLTVKMEKEIDLLRSQITNLHEEIKINELEYVIHTNIHYLEKLKKTYLQDIDEETEKINIVNVNDFKNDNYKIIKISAK
tara:strand:+ start:403 stop:717 length:315 start_codon:yes stop_codon:yes gene_type:complete